MEITKNELEKLVWNAAFKGTTDANKAFFKIDIEPIETEIKSTEVLPAESEQFTETELNEGISIIQAADLVGCREQHIKREIEAGRLDAYRKTGSAKGHFAIKRSEVLEKKYAIITRILRR